MKIIHVSRTPVAGAAWAAAESMREAGHDSWVFAPQSYNDGRRMPGHYGYPPSGRNMALLQDADVLVAHQGHPFREEWWPDKPTVAVYHSEPSHIWRKVEESCPWAVFGQDMADLYEGCRIVPNLIPLEHNWYQLGDKPKDTIRIAYSPSNRNGKGRNDKGYEATTKVLESLESDTVEVDIIEGVELSECLERKSTAHICIDECVVGYHRSSLEGLALGCVVINACDGANEARLLEMSGAPQSPFVRHKLTTVEAFRSFLHGMLAMGPERLEVWGKESRWWMDAYWTSKRLVSRCWMPLFEDAVNA